jgi:hypothetical protein
MSVAMLAKIGLWGTKAIQKAQLLGNASKALKGAKWLKGMIGDDVLMYGAKTAEHTVGKMRKMMGVAGREYRRVLAEGSEFGNLTAESLRIRRLQELGASAGIVGGVGMTLAAIDQNPETDPMEMGVRGGVSGSMWQAFGPAAGTYDAVSVSGMMGAASARMALNSPAKRHRIAAHMGEYTGSAGIDQYSGNLRRQALGYMMQSRQNTRTFLGSEARSMHDSGGY